MQTLRAAPVHITSHYVHLHTRQNVERTRYTPVNVDDEIPLEFRMAPVPDGADVDEAALLDPSQNAANLIRGTVLVGPDQDWVAKLDMTGLQSGTTYVYCFTDGAQTSSDVGVTRTAPAENAVVENFKYAVFSCARFDGYFHAYDIASTIDDLDLWIHVGDIIYEIRYAGSSSERNARVLPQWEAVDLQDYRVSVCVVLYIIYAFCGSRYMYRC